MNGRLQTATRGVEVRDCELEALLPSGRRRLLWGHASPLRDAAGRVRGAIAAFQDITATKQRTDALLRESEDRFRDTADAAPVMIWFGNIEKRLTFVNEQCVRFTGVSAERLLCGGWAQVIHRDDVDLVRKAYFEGVDSRAGYQVGYRIRRAGGEYRHMLSNTRPRYIGTEYAGHVGSVIDITDLKRTQEETLAKQKLQSVGTLANGIAHDFNNLLGALLAQSQLAMAELAAGSSPEHELKAIQNVAIHGAEIVRQLMIYAGTERESSGPIDVSRLIEEMMQLLKVSVSKHAALETDLARDLPPVSGSAAQLRQIVNASEAIGHQDGVIRVRTRRVFSGPSSSGATATAAQ